MSKIPTDRARSEPARHVFNGATMGTRWSAQLTAPAGVDPGKLRAALEGAVAMVDHQMSTWKPDSDLMRLNRAPVGAWTPVPAALMEVIVRGLEIGRLSQGAFDIGMGEAVNAWGFGPQAPDREAIARALGPVRVPVRAAVGVPVPAPERVPVRAGEGRAHVPAHDVLSLDPETRQVRKDAPVALDLSGIAKGYAVDRMMAVLDGFGISDALVGLDGELRARGRRPDGRPWTVAIERPDPEARAALSVIELVDTAVATSGDYRHWVEVAGERFSHTMDPAHCAPVRDAPASVTVLARSCMDADAWATALMVRGEARGAALARRAGLSAIFLSREGVDFRRTRVGWQG